MPVEADVYQKQYLLDPGMFVEALWPVQSAMPLLFVPPTASADGPNPFVERVSDGEIQRVGVTAGRTMDGLVQVVGNLRPDDLVVAQASHELVNGTRVQPRIRRPGGEG